jgi:peptide/nickel transport system substrate-binding protein
MMVEFEANSDYCRGKPKIERLILKFGESKVIELLSGNVDAVLDVSMADRLALRKDPRFRFYYATGNASVGIIWNQKHQKFSDPRIRRALTLAIDRKKLHNVINLPQDLLVFDVVHTRRQYLRGELPPPLPYNLEKAKELLEEAGWRDEDENGILERKGEEFRFKALTWERFREASIYVQEQLRLLGIRMELYTIDFYVLRRRLFAGDFEAVIQQVWQDYIYEGLFGKNSPLGYHNSRIEELCNAIIHTLNPDEKGDLCREMWPDFQKDLPITFLYPYTWYNVVHRRIHGLNNLYRTNPVEDAEHLWIEEEK